MAPTTSKKEIAFKSDWLKLYGLQITAPDINTTEVLNVQCRFCEFGGDEVDGEERQRKKTKNFKFFKKTWRSDNMKRHAEEQHSVRYLEYKKLNRQSKLDYFKEMEESRSLAALIRNSPDDSAEDDNRTTENVEDIFTLANGDNEAEEYYEASSSNKLQFAMIVSHISVGISFRQCSQLLLHSKEITGLGEIGNISVGKVIQVVQYTCAFNFETIQNVLDHIWAFSIATDGGTKASVPYLDVRLRLVLRRQLFNIHLIALPMYESHTGENIFLLISKFLDAICPNWKKKMINVSMDGASNMQGRHQGAVTCLNEVCSENFHRIWCGAHQLDLVVQAIFVQIVGL